MKPEIIQQVRTLHNLTEEQLPDDADEDTLEEVLSGIQAEPSGDPPEEEEREEEQEEEAEPVTATDLSKLKLPPGVSVIDTETLNSMRTDLKRLTDKDDESSKRERANEVATAIRDRKIPPSRKEHYTKLMETDPVGTRELLNSLEKGAVPGGPIGTEEDVSGSRSAAQGTGLLPELNRERSVA